MADKASEIFYTIDDGIPTKPMILVSTHILGAHVDLIGNKLDELSCSKKYVKAYTTRNNIIVGWEFDVDKLAFNKMCEILFLLGMHQSDNLPMKYTPVDL